MSAESLEAPAAQELMRHLEQCPECDEEWKTFQTVMFRLSTASQVLPSAEQSRRIWAACLEEVSRDVESKRVGAFGSETARGSGLSGFFNFAPRWSWALLGGAAAVFGAVWAFSPTGGPVSPTSTPTATYASFQAPPRYMRPLVNHHSAFAFDAFNDHTGTSLVSMGSTASSSSTSTADTPAHRASFSSSSP